MISSLPAALPTAAATGELGAAQIAQLKGRALFVRLETIRLIGIAKVGHYASAFSAAEIFAWLSRIDPSKFFRAASSARVAEMGGTSSSEILDA